jgi:hypothetical protein
LRRLAGAACPEPEAIVHAERGAQYTTLNLGLRQAGQLRMGSVTSGVVDNALIDSSRQ